MSVTHIDPDRLAGLAREQLAPSPEETTHLAACTECRLEARLVRAAVRLGDEAVAALDTGRVLAGVRERLTQRPMPAARRAIPRSVPWLAGLAAAAMLILAVRLYTERPRRDPAPVPIAEAGSQSTLHELDDLSAPELEAVLQTIPTAAAAMPHGDIVPLDDLTTSDLERVLRSMEE